MCLIVSYMWNAIGLKFPVLSRVESKWSHYNYYLLVDCFRCLVNPYKMFFDLKRNGKQQNNKKTSSIQIKSYKICICRLRSCFIFVWMKFDFKPTHEQQQQPFSIRLLNKWNKLSIRTATPRSPINILFKQHSNKE